MGERMREQPAVMIHAAPSRMYYVTEFLKPRLEAQGFKDIVVWNDTKEVGCRESYIASWSTLPDTGHTWHLQDDVLPDKRFYEWATSEWAEYPGIICGFGCGHYTSKDRFGFARNSEEMLYSFPCIRIPNAVAKDMLAWFAEARKTDVNILEKLPSGKFFDYFFKLYIGDGSREISIYNFFPNIVEHVDEYITGSLVNQQRRYLAKAMQFEDAEALADLEVWYQKHKH